MVQAECFANTWYLCREYGDIQDLRSYISEYAIVAQLVERCPSKSDVASSSLVDCSKFKEVFYVKVVKR